MTTLLDRDRPRDAIVLAPGAYTNAYGKAAHGLVRGSDALRVRAVLDADGAGGDAGALLDGEARGIPVVATLAEAVRAAPEASVAVVGTTTHGGRIGPELRALLLEAVRAGLHLVSGLHDFAGDDPEIAAEAEARGLEVVDVRRPPKPSALHFWTGAVNRVAAPRVAVLGTDCALGKRTTARLVVEALNARGRKAEMIYTGQTGALQGGRYGLILDSVPNDFVSGELEHAVVRCAEELAPEVMLIEGQSALRNPSGPCGAELILSAGARHVILQHAPERRCFSGLEDAGIEIPSLETELELLRLYGAETLAVTIHGPPDAPGLEATRAELRARLGLPVVHPLVDGVEPLADLVRGVIDAAAA